MQWFKTENIVNGLQKLDWSVVTETPEVLVLSKPKSHRPSIVLANTTESPDAYLRHVLSGISEFDVDAFVEGLTSVTVEETSDAQNEKAHAVKARSTLWNSPVVKTILSLPEGDAVEFAELTPDEINALSEDAKGVWSDHPDIRDSVEWVRELRAGLSTVVPSD